MDKSLDELNGYLNALGKFCGHKGWRYGFYATYMEIEKDVDSTLRKLVENIRLPCKFDARTNTTTDEYDSLCKYIGKTEIDYEKSSKILGEGLFSHFLIDTDSKQAMQIFSEVIWHIHEYLGLASNSIGGSFNPTVTGPMWSISVIRPDKKEFSYIALQIKNIVVFIGLEYE